MSDDSFFNIDESVPMPSERISIHPINNLDLGENQKLEFFIDPTSAQYIKPRASSLAFKVKINLPAGVSPTRLSLDNEIGANILCKEFRCWSGDRSVMLEEIVNMNSLIALKYDYDTDQNERNKRDLTEGTTSFDPNSRCTEGGFQQQGNNIHDNPYMDNYDDSTQSTPNFDVATNTKNKFITAKVVLPINSGLWSQERMLVVEAMGGLRLEWILEENKKVFRQLDTINYMRNPQSNPFFIEKTANGGDNIAKASKVTTFYVSGVNNQRKISNFPFVVGQRVKFVNVESSTGGKIPDKIASPQINGEDSGIIKTIAFEQNANGNKGAIAVTFTAENTMADNDVVAGESVLIDASISHETTFAPTYTISDAELLITKLMPPAPLVASINSLIKEKGEYKYDYPTYTCYKISQQKGDRVANLRLPINNSRCKAIACVPTDATIYTPKQMLLTNDCYAYDNEQVDYDVTKPFQKVLRANRTGITGIPDKISSYQMVYDNKLNPSEPVSLAKLTTGRSIDQVCLYENMKALKQMGFKCTSLKNYYHNYFIGRALSLGSGTYDARLKGDFNLQVNYEVAGTDGEPQKDKLWLCYVHHIRRLNITSSGMSVDV